MVIRFAIDTEDVVQFQRYHSMHSSTFKRKRRILILLFSILLVGWSLIIPLPEGVSRYVCFIFFVIWALVSSLLVVFVLPRMLYLLLPLLIRRRKGVIGEHEIEIDKSGIIDRTELNETRYCWHDVQQIENTESYLFIYVSSKAAHVIPKNSVITGNWDIFAEKAKVFWRSANSEVAI